MSTHGVADDFPVVGFVGGGQLARMAQQAAIALGIELKVLSVSPTDSAALVINGVEIGSHDDPVALRKFADQVDVLTFDHEHVPPLILDELIASGVTVRPGPKALIHAQDKLIMRQALTDAGLPVPAWSSIPADADDATRDALLFEFGEEVGWPFVLKTSRGGYDGRGVWVVQDLAEAQQVVVANPVTAPTAWLLEQKVPFTRELAAQVARSPHGQAVAYPVVQTVQRDGICHEVIAPAPDLDIDKAVESQRIALRVAELLDVTGMLAVELFDTPSGVLINELAMRPHNSGHWSMDGAVTSQFENHLRAVLDLPLGSPHARDDYTVMVNILGTDKSGLYSSYRHVMAADPDLKVHLYGKSPRPGRKLGHVNVVGSDLPQLLDRAHHAADYIAGEIDE